MNYKERILAAIKGDPIDELPFVPRLDLWYYSNLRNGTLPEKYKNATIMDISEDMDIGVHSVMSRVNEDCDDFVDYVDCGIDIYRVNRGFVYGTGLNNVRRNITQEKDKWRVEYVTPVGNVNVECRFTKSDWLAGSSIPTVYEPPVKTVEDLKVMQYIYENANVFPMYDKILEQQDALNDRGLVFAWGLYYCSAMRQLQAALMTYDNFVYTSYDYPDEVKAYADSYDKYLDRILDVCVKAPVDVVTCGSNIDSTLCSPPFMEEHVNPYLKKQADRLHEHGKFMACHLDGENHGSMDYIVKTGLDIADSIAPAPMTKIEFSEYRKQWKDITIFGGIPSIVTVKDIFSEYNFDKYMNDMMQELSDNGARHLILHVADALPPVADWKRVEKIAKIAKEFGAVK